jgi:hypothetical protein
MSEAEPVAGSDDALAALRLRAEALERQLQEVEARSTLQLRQAELKAEAVRAGIVDLDGLRLLDASAWNAPAGGTALEAGEVIRALRRDKPWLFGASQSSSAGLAPTAAPARRRMATDMSLDEWRAARAELIRRR